METLECEVCSQRLEGKSKGELFKQFWLHAYENHPDIIESQEAAGKSQFLDMTDKARMQGRICEAYLEETNRAYNEAVELWSKLERDLSYTLALTEWMLDTVDILKEIEESELTFLELSTEQARERFDFLEGEAKKRNYHW